MRKQKENIEKNEEMIPNMRFESEFRAKIAEILSHKMLAMPYSPINDQNGVLLSQFSKVEEPEQLWMGDFRLFSSLKGTVKKDADLVGCEILTDKETARSLRLRNLPREISVDTASGKKDVFSMKTVGCFGVSEFNLPLVPSDFNPNVFHANTNFSTVVECLSYDLYEEFLKQTERSDSEECREEFLVVLKDSDAMEFVERADEHAASNLHFNHDDQRKNFVDGQAFKKFYVVFHNFVRTESAEVVEAAHKKNQYFEQQAKKKEAAEKNVSL